MHNRRDFFRGSLVALALGLSSISSWAASGKGTGESFQGPVGLQLYTLRAEFLRYGVPATLDKVRDFGIRNVELAGTYNLKPEVFVPMLKERGLLPVSGHFPFNRLRDDVDGVVAEAKALGLKYAGCAWINHKDTFDKEECIEAAKVFNKVGEALHREGIQFFYHIHGYEFQPYGEKETLFDLLVRETHKEHVAFEMDVFWVIHPGQNPVKLLRQHGKRWKLMHLKDMKKGVETGILTGKSDVSNDVTLGTGQMNWPAILKAAKQAGVEYYFIEDESPTAEKHVPESLKFLESVQF